MMCYSGLSVLVLTVVMVIIGTNALTGHVCRRMAQETYLVKDTRAFLCNERYTTSCGHLDWRRCTKYRVQTCYGPNERYATRYKQVEECCPGWQQAAGSCTIPVCQGLCQNGGVCSQTGAVPHCSCLPEYRGDFCQHKRGETQPKPPLPSSSSSPSNDLSFVWIIVTVVVVLVLVAAVYVARQRLKQSAESTNPTRACCTQSPTSPSSSSRTGTKETSDQTPVPTISGSMMTPRIVQPSAPFS